VQQEERKTRMLEKNKRKYAVTEILYGIGVSSMGSATFIGRRG
jgi:hypothetical protein